MLCPDAPVLDNHDAVPPRLSGSSVVHDPLLRPDRLEIRQTGECGLNDLRYFSAWPEDEHEIHPAGQFGGQSRERRVCLPAQHRRRGRVDRDHVVPMARQVVGDDVTVFVGVARQPDHHYRPALRQHPPDLRPLVDQRKSVSK